jgi:HAD superfamily hydrolase (TIGR01490 family)
MLCRVSTASSPTPQPARTGARSQTKRPAAFFDLDKTVIAKSSALVFSRPLYRSGLINRRDVLRSAYAQFVYVLGGADHDQMERMREYLSALTEGWDADQLREIVAEALQEAVEPIIYEEAANLIDEHHAAGRDVVIVSSSGQEIVELIGAMLGADHSIGTRVAIVDGQYTGQIEFYAYAENKAQAMRDLADERGYDLSQSYAYSDAATQQAVLGSAKFTERALADVRRRGWAQSAAEREPGVASVSAPVRDHTGEVVAAVSVSGPIDRMGRRPGARWAADLLAAADDLRHRL